MKYLLSLGGRTVHRADSTDGRCKIKLISDENRMMFDSFSEAMNYMPPGKKITKPCSFCLGKNYTEIR